jgi:hypothetical protein
VWHIKKLIKWHSHYTDSHSVGDVTKNATKICSFVTQHNATKVSSLEGACNWHADCRTVQQEPLPDNLMLISVASNVFENLAVGPNGLITADHVSPRQPRTSTSNFFTYRIV